MYFSPPEAGPSPGERYRPQVDRIQQGRHRKQFAQFRRGCGHFAFAGGPCLRIAFAGNRTNAGPAVEHQRADGGDSGDRSRGHARPPATSGNFACKDVILTAV